MALTLLGAAVPAALAEEAVAINPAVEGATDEINPAVEGQATGHLTDDAAGLPRVRIDFDQGSIDEVARRVLAQMTLGEKVGQLGQVTTGGDTVPDAIAEDLRKGRIGSLFYTGSAKQTREAKRIALEESRLGIPLLTPRDVIHGFRTVAPIPLGQAASWNPEAIEAACKLAADEAALCGVNWTFAPMLDISRDARWGRIAESLGEDPVLASAISTAMVRGYQQPAEQADGSTRFDGIAACAKHFAAYGLTEGGRDYNRVQVARSQLHNVILPPFHAAVEAGCATFMTGFSSINGIPPSGHRELLRDVLKEQWGFEGLVVSDWASVVEMIAHGYAANRREAARLALTAGLDMEMATDTYREFLVALLESGEIDTTMLDEAVLRILRVKLQFARGELADDDTEADTTPTAEGLATAKRLATESCVLLKNEGLLPLSPDQLNRVAVIGPLADAARDQLGCWMLDGKAEEAVTPLAALKSALAGQAEVSFVSALKDSIDPSTDGIAAAAEAAADSDAVVLCVGEGWGLSGEARCRADLNLPGAQRELVRAVAATGKPVVMVVLAGRPLTLGAEADLVDAVLYAWHPGTMGGPAIADLLLGVESPSGKLPVTFAKHVGQSPLYYNHPSTGRPAVPETKPLIGSGLADFPELQKYRSHYLDVDPFPLYPFGYGLSYTEFEYGEAELSASTVEPGQTVGVRVRLTNTGQVAATEVAQLYVQDVTAQLVRPVRELKRFRRVELQPGETTVLEFALTTDDLAYFDNVPQRVLEPGDFRVGVGGDSTAPLDVLLKLRRTERTSNASSASDASAR